MQSFLDHFKPQRRNTESVTSFRIPQAEKSANLRNHEYKTIQQVSSTMFGRTQHNNKKHQADAAADGPTQEQHETNTIC
jgi:hypothetical protein